MTMLKKLSTVVFASTAYLVTGCKEIDVTGIGSVSRIEIVDNLGRKIKTITEPDKITDVVAFVNRHRAGWGKPWYGIPVPVVVANFYDDNRFKGHFGIGPNFFEAHCAGEFFSKSATEQEIRESMDILGLPRLPARGAGK